jgi:hypothetical protein
MAIFNQPNPLAPILTRPDQSIMPIAPKPQLAVAQPQYQQMTDSAQVPIRKTEAGKLDNTMVSSVMGITGSEPTSQPLTTLEEIVERGKRLQKGIARYDE